MNEWPECEDFYDLMQQYRHTPIEKPDQVVAAYEAVKQWLRNDICDRFGVS